MTSESPSSIIVDFSLLHDQKGNLNLHLLSAIQDQILDNPDSRLILKTNHTRAFGFVKKITNELITFKSTIISLQEKNENIDTEEALRLSPNLFDLTTAAIIAKIFEALGTREILILDENNHPLSTADFQEEQETVIKALLGARLNLPDLQTDGKMKFGISRTDFLVWKVMAAKREELLYYLHLLASNKSFELVSEMQPLYNFINEKKPNIDRLEAKLLQLTLAESASYSPPSTLDPTEDEALEGYYCTREAATGLLYQIDQFPPHAPQRLAVEKIASGLGHIMWSKLKTSSQQDNQMYSFYITALEHWKKLVSLVDVNCQNKVLFLDAIKASSQSKQELISLMLIMEDIYATLTTNPSHSEESKLLISLLNKAFENHQQLMSLTRKAIQRITAKSTDERFSEELSKLLPAQNEVQLNWQLLTREDLKAVAIKMILPQFRSIACNKQSTNVRRKNSSIFTDVERGHESNLRLIASERSTDDTNAFAFFNHYAEKTGFVITNTANIAELRKNHPNLTFIPFNKDNIEASTREVYQALGLDISTRGRTIAASGAATGTAAWLGANNLIVGTSVVIAVVPASIVLAACLAYLGKQAFDRYVQLPKAIKDNIESMEKNISNALHKGKLVPPNDTVLIGDVKSLVRTNNQNGARV